VIALQVRLPPLPRPLPLPACTLIQPRSPSLASSLTLGRPLQAPGAEGGAQGEAEEGRGAGGPEDAAACSALCGWWHDFRLVQTLGLGHITYHRTSRRLVSAHLISAQLI